MSKANGMLEVSNLTVSFERPDQQGAEAFRVVEDVSFRVAAGEFVSILGPSGCGKTTLLRVIVRLVPAERGTIKIAASERYAPGRDVCLVFQSYGLFPWRTVRENVEFGLKMQGVAARERRAAGQEFIDLVGLSGFEGPGGKVYENDSFTGEYLWSPGFDGVFAATLPQNDSPTIFT